MAGSGKELQAKASSIPAGLIPGLKGSKVVYEVDGMKRLAFGMGLAVERLEEDLKATHLRRIGDLTRKARELFYGDTRRPSSSGDRPNVRMTGRFTFGARGGGTFVGVLIDEKSVQGFGYPNVPRADARTKFVWRTLEFGLGDKGEQHPLAPLGDHLLPRAFGFDPPTRGRRDARFFPVRGPADVKGGGIEPKTGKGFIRPAFEYVKPFLRMDYEDAAKKFPRNLRR